MEDFQYTDKIRRYNQKMIQYWNDWSFRVPTYDIETCEPLSLKTRETGETQEDNVEENRIAYLDSLIKAGAILYKPEWDGALSSHQIADDGTHDIYPSEFYVNVRDIKPILRIENLYSGNEKIPALPDPDREWRYFRMNDKDFVFGIPTEKPTNIPFKNKTVLYFLIFKALFELAPSHPEYVPYEKINARLGSKAIPDGEKSVARIRSAIQVSLKAHLKRAKVNMTLHGKQVLENVPDKGFRFYNPIMPTERE